MWFKRQVKKGLQFGKKLGFPTINLEVGNFKDHFEVGVYQVELKINEKIFKGAMHYGPTVHHSENQLEIFILNFDEDLYDSKVSFRVTKKIREPMRFTDLNELKSQISKDVESID